MLKTVRYFFTRIYTIISIVLFIFTYTALKVGAIYYPTDNITNPSCAPGDSGCYVSLLPDQTSNSGSLLFTNGTNPSWSSGLSWDSANKALSITGANSTATIGSEMINAIEDRDFSSDSGNWTGSNWTVGSGVITHTAGVADVLTLSNSALSSAPASGDVYQVTFTVNTTTAGTLTVSIGGTNGVSVGQVVGSAGQNQIITAVNTTELKFTPNSAWAGTIDNVSVKVITPSNPIFTIKNSDNTMGFEIRSGGSGLKNVHIGENASSRNVTGNNRVSIGYYAGFNDQSNNNIFIGSVAGYNHVSGVSNTIVGVASGYNNTTGASNVFFGTNSGRLGVNSNNNTFLGTAAGYKNQSSDNVFIGMQTGYNSESSAGSIVIGSNAGFGGVASQNTILGTAAGYSVTGTHNTFVGYANSGSGTIYSGANNISIGSYVRPISSTGNQQLNIGNVLYGQGIYNGTSVSSTATALGAVGIGSGTKLSRFTVTAPTDTSDIGGTTTANASTTITGVGTLFTTSLGIGDRISLSSTPGTYATVTAIASDTSLTVDTALGNGTSQTINRKKSIFRVDDASNVTKFLIQDDGSTSINSIITNPFSFGGGSFSFEGKVSNQPGNIIAMGNNLSLGNPVGRVIFGHHYGATYTRVADIVANSAGGDDGANLVISTKPTGGALTARVTISSTGVITFSPLTSCGGLQTNGSGTLSCTSDERLKDIQGDFTKGLEAIRNINPKAFSWKQDSNLYDNGIIYNGFIAQNIQSALPEAISTSSDGIHLQVSQLTLLAASINAIKELDIKVNQLSSLDTTLTGSFGYLAKEFLNTVNIYIKDLTVGKLKVDGDVCVDDVCISKEQFKQMLIDEQNRSGQVVNVIENTQQENEIVTDSNQEFVPEEQNNEQESLPEDQEIPAPPTE